MSLIVSAGRCKWTDRPNASLSKVLSVCTDRTTSTPRELVTWYRVEGWISRHSNCLCNCPPSYRDIVRHGGRCNNHRIQFPRREFVMEFFVSNHDHHSQSTPLSRNLSGVFSWRCCGTVGYFLRSCAREWPLRIVHLESVDSTEKLGPLNNKECLIMGCNILARFASTLKPPRSGDGLRQAHCPDPGTAASAGFGIIDKRSSERLLDFSPTCCVNAAWHKRHNLVSLKPDGRRRQMFTWE